MKSRPAPSSSPLVPVGCGGPRLPRCQGNTHSLPRWSTQLPTAGRRQPDGWPAAARRRDGSRGHIVPPTQILCCPPPSLPGRPVWGPLLLLPAQPGPWREPPPHTMEPLAFHLLLTYDRDCMGAAQLVSDGIHHPGRPCGVGWGGVACGVEVCS